MVNFTWALTKDTNFIRNYEEAARWCSLQNGHLPSSEEMRYFYKTLQPIRQMPLVVRRGDSPQGNLDETRASTVDSEWPSLTFYLLNVLEATMDYPSAESGERMCLVIKKENGKP
ncbi:unnamed protein product, partial [Protopolystoma xenopodis]